MAIFCCRVFLLFTVVGWPIYFNRVHAQSVDDVATRRAKLESDLKILESQIEAQREIVESKQKQAVSLERDIAIFDASIKKANLSIKARDIAIQQLSSNISSKEKTIGILSEKLNRELESLAELIRKTDQIDNISFSEFYSWQRNSLRYLCGHRQIQNNRRGLEQVACRCRAKQNCHGRREKNA